MNTSEDTTRCGRRRASSPAPAPDSPLDDDDLLREILLRLPPQPCSLPRASLVCKRWRRLVADPHFLRLLRAHHRRPPPLGFFVDDRTDCLFVPTLDPPDRVPAARFSPPRNEGDHIVDCRHGLVLFLNQRRGNRRLLVWDPVTREQRRLAFPPELEKGGDKVIFHGAVLCPAGGESCFQVAVLAANRTRTRVFACLYSSATGVWGAVASAEAQSFIAVAYSSALVGDSVCWLLTAYDQPVILEFDLAGQSLAVIDLPPHVDGSFWIMPAEDGLLCLMCLSGFRAQFWNRKAGSDLWVLVRTIQLENLRPVAQGKPLNLVGFVEDSNAVLVRTASGAFMVCLRSLTLKKLSDREYNSDHYPFETFYAAGGGIGDGQAGGEVLHNM